MSTQIGKYLLGRELGHGGMGIVYESFHPQLARPVAIKLLQSNDAAAQAVFIREAQLVASLSHPHIINIFDVDEHQGQPFFVMELFGGSLADQISQGPLPIATALPIALTLIDALGYAHAQGIIHGDLKPANVLLRQDGTPILADFGLAHATMGSATSTDSIPTGTPEYIAPEKVRGQPASQRSDLYAFGVLLFECLSGQPPFTGDLTAILGGHLLHDPPLLSSRVPGISLALEGLVLSLLDKNPDQRPPDAATVAQVLKAIPTTAPARTPIPQPVAAIGPTIALKGSITAQQSPAPPSPINTTQNNQQAIAQLPTKHPAHQRASLLKLALVAIPAILLVAIVLATIAPTKRTVPRATIAVPTLRSLPTRASLQALQPLKLRQTNTAPMYNSQPATNTPDFSYAGVTSEATANAISFYGEIQNKSTLAQAKIYVVVTLLDANGQELGTARKLAERGYLLPGETAPFYVLFFRDAVPRVKFTSYRIAIESEPADTFARGYYLHDGLDLAVSEVGQDGTGDYPVVRGVFNNQRSTAVNYPKIIAVFYNEAGEVIGITDCYAKGRGEKLTLAAGTSAPFETIFFSLTERDPTAYMLYAEASRP